MADNGLAYIGPTDHTATSLVYYLANLNSLDMPYVACDVETVSTADRRLIGIGLALNAREAVYFKVLPDPSPYLDLVWQILLRAGRVVYHNASFDLTAKMEYLLDNGHGGEGPRYHVPPIIHLVAEKSDDTVLMSQVQGLPGNELAGQTGRYLDTTIQRISDILPAKQNMLDLPWEDVAFKCLHDCLSTLRLFYKMRGPEWCRGQPLEWHHSPAWSIEEGFDPSEPLVHPVTVAMQDCYNVDRCLLSTMMYMSARGILLRPNEVDKWYNVLSEEMLVYQDIVERAGLDAMGIPINPGSNQQVGLLLATRGNVLPFTKSRKQLKVDDETLSSIDDPLVVPIIEYRKRAKLKGTYIVPLRGHDRAYTHFRQDLSTSRWASYDMNMQNIPADPRNLRDIFAPDSSDGIWTSCDASQLEYRILAHVSGDVAMQKAYEEGGDLHANTQQMLWPGSNPESKWHRVQAKTYNFAGLAYMGTPETLSKHSKLPVTVCKEYLGVLNETYPGVRKWQAHTIEDGWNNGWVENVFGRRCRLPKLDPLATGTTADHVEKCAVNYPIQSAGIDIVKRAMLDPQVYRMDQVLQVHDEILVDGRVEFPLERLERIGPLLTPFKQKHGAIWQ